MPTKANVVGFDKKELGRLPAAPQLTAADRAIIKAGGRVGFRWDERSRRHVKYVVAPGGTKTAPAPAARLAPLKRKLDGLAMDVDRDTARRAAMVRLGRRIDGLE